MKSLTLFQRIILWSICNLILLAVIFLGYVNVRVHAPADSLLAGSMGERFQLLPYIIGRELSDRPRSQWADMLKEHARAQQAEIFILARDGSLVAGSRDQLPEEVRKGAAQYLAEMLPAPLPQTPDGTRPAMPPEGLPGPRPGMGPQELGRPMPRGLPVREHTPFSMQTGSPRRYWAGLPIMVLGRPPDTPVRGVMVVSSDSMTGHGLFFDPIPWLISFVVVVAVSMLWWWPLIRGITRPLARITRATEKIARGHFEVRLEEKRRDEIGRLSQAINEMGSRLKALIWGHKHFLGSVGHELASPVARIKLGLGILEQELPEEHRPRLQSVMDDAEHMSDLLDELLSFSRAELNPAKADLRDIALLPLVQEAWWREGRDDVELELDILPDLMVRADPGLLKRALGNLLRNAVRYAGMAGPIGVQAAETSGRVSILVRDQGPGVPAEDLPLLFEPFHQTGAAQPRTAGVGMGLSIVKTCLEACQGQVACRNRAQGGLEVELLLKAPAGGREAA